MLPNFDQQFKSVVGKASVENSAFNCIAHIPFRLVHILRSVLQTEAKKIFERASGVECEVANNVDGFNTARVIIVVRRMVDAIWISNVTSSAHENNPSEGLMSFSRKERY